MSGEISISGEAFITAWQAIGKNICQDSMDSGGNLISLSSINVENYYDSSMQDNPKTPSLWYAVAEKVFQLPAYKGQFAGLSEAQKQAALKTLEKTLAEKFGTLTLYGVINENDDSTSWFFNSWDHFKEFCPQSGTKRLPQRIKLKISAADIGTAIARAKATYPSPATPDKCAPPKTPANLYLPLMPGPVTPVIPTAQSSEVRLTVYSTPDPARTGAPAILQISGGELFNLENSTVRIYREDGSEVTSTILEGRPDIKEGLIKLTIKADTKPGLYRVSVMSSKILGPVKSETSVSKDGDKTVVALQPFTIMIEHGRGTFRVLEARKAAPDPSAVKSAGDKDKNAQKIADWKRKCQRISNKGRRKECIDAAERKEFVSAQRIYDEEMGKQDQACALKHCAKIEPEKKTACENDVEDNDLSCAATKRKYPIPVNEAAKLKKLCEKIDNKDLRQRCIKRVDKGDAKSLGEVRSLLIRAGFLKE